MARPTLSHIARRGAVCNFSELIVVPGSCRRLCFGEEGAGRSWKVGLERASGKRVYVNYFNARANVTCEKAKQFAVELSELTGLPLSPEITAS